MANDFTREQEENLRSAQRLIRAYEQQADTFGMTARQAEIYKLALQGVSQVHLDILVSQDKTLTALEEQAKAEQEAAREQQRLIKQTAREQEQAAREQERLAQRVAREQAREQKQAAREQERLARQTAKEEERTARDRERLIRQVTSAQERAVKEQERLLAAAAMGQAREQKQAAREQEQAAREQEQEDRREQERAAKARENFFRQGRNMLQQATAGVAGIAGTLGSGRVPSTEEGIGAIQQITNAIPIVGPLIGSVLGGAIRAAYADSDRLHKSINGTMEAIITGSQSAAQAVRNIGLSAFASEFTRVNEMAQARRTGTFTVRQRGEEEVRRLLAEDLTRAAGFAQRAEQGLQTVLADPQVRRALEVLRTGEARNRVFEARGQANLRRDEAEVRAQAIQRGAAIEEARDLGEEMRRVNDLALSIWNGIEPWEDAIDRAWRATGHQNERLRESNALLRRAVAEEAMVTRGRQDEVRNQAQTQTVGFLRIQAQTGMVMVDHAEQRVQAQDDFNRGLLTEMALRDRLVQIGRNETAERQRRDAEEVNRRMEANRRPLERFRFERERLEQLRPEFMARPGGAEQFQREQANLAQRLIDAAGDLYRLPQVFEFGAAATASAISRAEREQRAADPATSLRMAVENLTIQAAEQSRFQEQMVRALEEIRAAGLLPPVGVLAP